MLPTTKQLHASGTALCTTHTPCVQALCVPVRQVVGWFEVGDQTTFHADTFPVFIIQEEKPTDLWYGFPQYGFQPGEWVCEVPPQQPQQH